MASMSPMKYEANVQWHRHVKTVGRLYGNV